MKHLRTLRKLAGFKNVRSAAENLNISICMLYYIEQGKRKPSIEIAGRMIKAYKCSLDDIFLPYIVTDSNI